MRRLLILRPEPGASATVRRAGELGLRALAVPLFEVGPVSWEAQDPARFDGLLLTSANAVRHGGKKLARLRGLPVYAVGEATADAARDAGFEIAVTGDGGIDWLLGSIDSDLRLLHLCGEDRREPAGAQQAITSLAVYRAKPVERPDLRGARGAVALIHSARAGQRFAELVQDRESIVIAAISPFAAQAAADCWEAVEIADAPTNEALLALAARLCNNSPPK